MSTEAIALASPLIQASESCVLRAYPDPKWKGVARTPDNWTEWGRPWTCGWGETGGVVEGVVWTQEYADQRFRTRIASTAVQVLHACPQLACEPAHRLAACISLAYNIGIAAFRASTVRARTMRRDYAGAANAFPLWNKAGGRVMPGLVVRRAHERSLYLGQA